MNYWEGTMNWPIDPDWKCEVCEGIPGLTWGFVHATCHCDLCHVEYTMRDGWTDGNPRVTLPICLLKAEYKAVFIKLWAKEHRPVDQITDEEWVAAGIILETVTA